MRLPRGKRDGLAEWRRATPAAARVLGLRRHLRGRAWLVYPLVLAPLCLLYNFGPSAFNAGWIFNLIGASAAVAVLVGVKLNRVRPRLPWLLFALGQALFVGGDVIAYNYHRFFGKDLPFPSLADGLYLSVYPSLMLGLLILIRRRSTGRDLASLIDSVIIWMGAALLSWIFLIAPYAHDRSLNLPTKLISVAYPLMDLLVLGVAVRIAVGAGKRGAAFYLVVSSVVALFVTDAIYGWLLLHGGYSTGGLLDSGWMIFYLLWGAAALHPSMPMLSQAAPELKPKVTLRRLALLACATLVSPIVQGYEFLNGTPDFLVTIASAVLFTLVVIRMAGLVKEQERAATRARDEIALRRRTEERFSSLVQNSSDVVAVVTADLRVTYVTPSIERVLGYRAEDLIGTEFGSFVAADDVERVLEFVRNGSADGELVEFAARSHSGEWLHVETLRTDLLDDPNVGGIVLNTRDISERKAFEKQLADQAYRDTVTGLANRFLFRERVDRALDRRAIELRPPVVLFLDLDDFKTVNDSLGHAAGDELLSQVGRRLAGCIRPHDTAARLGGDEFAILLEDVHSRAEASIVSERILAALEKPFVLEGKEVYVHGSLGIAYGDTDGVGAVATEELLRNADAAMYAAKGSGKRRVEVYEGAMHRAALERLDMKADLERALEHGEFVLHYQPIVVVATGEIRSVEALLRWQHPTRGTMAPADFIPLAEESGLICPIGRWVLGEACHRASVLQEFNGGSEPISVSVNLSPRQLEHPEIVAEVRAALEASRLDPACLVLEVTESAMIYEGAAAGRLAELKQLGVKLALDDFGTGYSSLDSVSRFPFDILKIDKSFVAGIADGNGGAALPTAILELARVLALRPIAEGVEQASQLACLEELGCELAQGYHLSVPMTGAAIEALVEKRATERLLADKRAA